jgi:tryptophanyl-tRNA synthetase
VWRAFATPQQTQEMRAEFAAGIAWGEAKRRLFELLDATLLEPRRRYEELMAQPSLIERLLREGAERAREVSAPFLKSVREATGIRPVDG